MVFTNVAVQAANDGPGVLSSGDDGKALVWDNATGAFVMTTMGGGGGTSDHAALTHLAYTDSGHTGFAGTGVANTFTRQQVIGVSFDDMTLDNSSIILNAGLSDWVDDASGWAWSSGVLMHAPGVGGTLTQSITPIANLVYVLEVQVSLATAGTVEIYNNAGLYIFESANGTYKALTAESGTSDLITINVSADWDGEISLISLRAAQEYYPQNMIFHDIGGYKISEIRVGNGGIFWGNEAGKLSQDSNNVGIGNYALDSIINETANLAFGANAGKSARCNNGLFLGTASGENETVDNRLHIGNSGDLISGTMDSGNAATQSLKFHAATINMADLPTSSAGLTTGDLYTLAGALMVA